MNKIDRANLQAVLDLANKLMDAPKKMNNPITDAMVVEAILEDIGKALSGKAPFELMKLVAQEEAEEGCTCPTPKIFHYKGCAVLVAHFNGYTSDGHPITHGLAVWDYNVKPGLVSLDQLGDDGWFEVVGKGQTRGSLMNSERVCVRHPYTGQLASDALKGM